MKDRTTIQLEKEIRELLKQNKRYPRETYGDTIKRLLKKDKLKMRLKAS